jgi:hypothetical protein
VPRFFIDTHDGDFGATDDEGQAFADAAAARRAALRALPEMARDGMPDGDYSEFIVNLRNADGEGIYTATLTLRGAWREAGADIIQRT